MNICVRLTCRLCGGGLRKVLSLTPTPIANAFALQRDTGADRYPLDLMQCTDCEHVQLRHVVDAQTLYSDYLYETPEAARRHLDAAAKTLRGRYPKAISVLEIGSNNGLYLPILDSYGFDPTGCDPAARKHKSMYPAYPHLFGYGLARSMHRSFDLIVANNTFAHIDDLDDVFAGITHLLAPGGALVFEVQYLPKMMERGAFDMIYHEHHDYHTLGPLAAFGRKHGLALVDTEALPTHGGSVRCYMEAMGSEVSQAGESLDWPSFAERIESAKRTVLSELDATDEQIVAFGATAKACTLIHHFGIADRIAYAVDSTQAKHGRYIPGTAIKIMPGEVLLQSKSAKTLFLTAWNFADHVSAKYPDLPRIVPFAVPLTT